MTAHGAGTRIDLDCTYASVNEEYGASDWTYRMVVTHADGRTEDVTSWRALPDKTIHLSTGTAAARGDIQDVTIEDSDGIKAAFGPDRRVACHLATP